MEDSLNVIAYKLLEKVRREVNDDESITLRQIKDDIHDLRAVFLKRYLDKGHAINDAITQDLKCVPLEYADPADCCSVETDCLVLRTAVTIPKFLQQNKEETITRIGPINKLNIAFDIISFHRVPFALEERFGRSIKAFLLNDRIYIISKNKVNLLLEKINIRGVFEDPTEAAKFVSCEGQPCYTDDSKYPITKDMKNSIVDTLFKQYVGETGMPEDETNDSNPKLTGTKTK